MDITMPFKPSDYQIITEELTKLGYTQANNNFENKNYVSVDKTLKRFSFLKHKYNEFLIDNNIELLIAIVNMSEDPNGVPGEYWKYIGEENATSYKQGNLYKAIKPINKTLAIIDEKGKPDGFNSFSNNHNIKLFQKATFEEILKYFSNRVITSEMMAEKLKKIQELVK